MSQAHGFIFCSYLLDISPLPQLTLHPATSMSRKPQSCFHLICWVSDSPFRPGGGSQEARGLKPRGEKLLVSWFSHKLVESFQLELFKLWLDQFYMSSHWGSSSGRLGLFLYVQSEVDNWGNYLQANESGLCNQPILITGRNRPHSCSFALS
jgi:hypothetical protein